MQLLLFSQQFFYCFTIHVIGNAAVDRTHRRARLLIEEPDALGALLGNDVEDVVRDRVVHPSVLRLPLDRALVDGRVRALGLARAAVDALGRDHRGHDRQGYRRAGRGSKRARRQRSLD